MSVWRIATWKKNDIRKNKMDDIFYFLNDRVKKANAILVTENSVYLPDKENVEKNKEKVRLESKCWNKCPIWLFEEQSVFTYNKSSFFYTKCSNQAYNNKSSVVFLKIIGNKFKVYSRISLPRGFSVSLFLRTYVFLIKINFSGILQ